MVTAEQIVKQKISKTKMGWKKTVLILQVIIGDIAHEKTSTWNLEKMNLFRLQHKILSKD